MSILVGNDTKLSCQGMGRAGTFHYNACIEYGTNVVGGVHPGKGGTTISDRPVFNTVAEAVEKTGANTTMIFVPAPGAADAVLEAVDAGIELVICITEGVPVVWSQESPNDLDPFAQAEFQCICSNRGENALHQCEKRLQIQGSVSWMPSIFGLTMAGVVANDLIGREVRSDLSRKIVRMEPAVGKPSKARKKELMEKAGYTRGDEASP